MSDPQPRLVDAPTAAGILQLSERYVRQLTVTGELPGVRFGRAVRYDLADLEAFIDARRSGEVTV